LSFPIAIPIRTNWNYYSHLGTNTPALQVLQQEISNNTFIKAIDNQGNSIEFIPGIGLVDNIKIFENGKVYKLKVKNNSTIILNN
jgi:hypothetical protein